MKRSRATMNPNRPHEPAVRQPPCNGWEISWNPDNKRWCVEHPTTLEIVADYADRRNAIAYARGHKPPID